LVYGWVSLSRSIHSLSGMKIAEQQYSRAFPYESIPKNTERKLVMATVQARRIDGCGHDCEPGVVESECSILENRRINCVLSAISTSISKV